jgi:hypothetical protein
MPWNAADFQTLPLTAAECKRKNLPAGLMATSAEQLFPHARDAKAALAGALLLYGHWDLSHQVAQDVETREGSYWHAIAHRIEPDSWNSGYWFRRVGEHPIFNALFKDAENVLAAAKTGWRLKKSWDPYLFIEWCDEARGTSNAEKIRAACAIQRLECEHLFHWCSLNGLDPTA